MDLSRPIATFTATRAKQNFGELLDAAGRGPVAIDRHGRVMAIVVAPVHWSTSTSAATVMAERQLARAQQQLVERDRFIRHQRIAVELLTASPSQAKARVRAANQQVLRWRREGLCSADLADRWDSILCLPLRELARALTLDHEGWGPALRQNSPWVTARE